MNRLRLILLAALVIFIILSYKGDDTVEQQNCTDELQVEVTMTVPSDNQ